MGEELLYEELKTVYSRKLGFFADNEFLSDCTVKGPDGRTFKVHRVILATSSTFFFTTLKKSPQTTAIDVPEPIPPTYGQGMKAGDVFPTVLRFMYANQEATVLTADLLNAASAFSLLALGHILGVKRLVDVVSQFIAEKVLNDDNGAEVLLEGLKYMSETLQEAALDAVVSNLESIVRRPGGLEALTNLPFSQFKGICEDNLASVSNEGTVYGLICSYLQKREALPEEQVEAQGVLGMKRLTQEEKFELLSCVRFSYLTHNELLQAASNGLVAMAKDLILEGLSLQLVELDSPPAADYAYRVSREPRKSYEVKRPGMKSKETLKSASVEVRSEEQTSRQADESEDDEREEEKHDYMHDARLYRSQQLQRQTHREVIGTLAASVQGALRQSSPPRPPQRLRGPYSSLTGPKEFVYSYDFDDNGLLYYLGSSGRTRPWANPHVLGNVVAFSSSIGFGKVEEFVGRVAGNLRTTNEPNSYIGVDLGLGRLLAPTAYTLRNRNSSSHVCLNWQLEGSNNRYDWKVLDRRIHFSGDPGTDAALEEERQQLKQKGASTTWGVAPEMTESVRYLRIVQLDKNSSGSYNLALSGFEVYGKLVS
jgi:hypothetical protein